MISKNLQKLVRKLELKKFRRLEGLFVAEGPKVVDDLLRHGFKPAAIVATKEWIDSTAAKNADAKDARDASATKDTIATKDAISVSGKMDIATIPTINEVTDEELRRISLLQHPQKVLALFPIPVAAVTPSPAEGELCLALDGVQDPGNLGTIVRIADWFGIRKIYCSEDTADVWSPKVVQATMGSIARVEVFYCDLRLLLSSTHTPVYGTLLDGEDIYRATLTRGGIIVMGNEGNGISDDIRPLVSQRLLIPGFSAQEDDKAESLNVAIATAITCSEFRRRL